MSRGKFENAVRLIIARRNKLRKKLQNQANACIAAEFGQTAITNCPYLNSERD